MNFENNVHEIYQCFFYWPSGMGVHWQPHVVWLVIQTKYTNIIWFFHVAWVFFLLALRNKGEYNTLKMGSVVLRCLWNSSCFRGVAEAPQALALRGRRRLSNAAVTWEKWLWTNSGPRRGIRCGLIVATWEQEYWNKSKKQMRMYLNQEIDNKNTKYDNVLG